MSKYIHIISGGTVGHVATHLGLCAPAYGSTGYDLWHTIQNLRENGKCKLEVRLHETALAGAQHDSLLGRRLETNTDVEELVDKLVADPNTKIIFMPVAMLDYEVNRLWDSDPDTNWPSQREHGKGAKRLSTRRDGVITLELKPAPKIISKIRKTRKDIFLVGFKTTDGVTEDEQYLAGLGLLKEASCNLVLANDVKTKLNMIVTPEEARYHVTNDRHEALANLIDMALLRSHLTFTRSTIVAGESVPWDSAEVFPALRTVVDHLVARGAYKPFRGATVGHFACKISDTEFLTSKRKTNFNDLKTNGLVRIRTDGPDSVIAFGARPSVGGQSQRIVFAEHPEYDCIVHAHVPMRPEIHKPGYWNEVGSIPVMSQREFECGSHQCGQNTSTGLKRFGNLSAVFLDQHGPNVVFHHSIDPQEVIDFIEANFDLAGKTGGHVG